MLLQIYFIYLFHQDLLDSTRQFNGLHIICHHLSRQAYQLSHLLRIFYHNFALTIVKKS